MKKDEERSAGVRRERRQPQLYLMVLLVVVITLLAVGLIAVSVVLSPPFRYVAGGGLTLCILALALFLTFEWWRFREQNKEYIDEITDLNLRFGILADAVSAVSSTLDIEELVANILGVMLTLTNSRIGVVLVPDEDMKYLQVLSYRGFQEQAVRGLKLPVDHGSIGKAFTTGQVIIRDNLPADPKAHETYTDGKSPRSQIIMPLRAKGQTVGVAVTATCEEHEYKPEEVSLLSSLCHELAVAMINVELYQKSQKTLEWLAETQEYTEHFIQEMLAGVIVVNNEGDVIYFNREAADMMKIEPKEVIGVNYRDLVEEREKFKSLSYLQPVLRLCLEEERVFRRHEIVIEGPDGGRMVLNYNAFPMHRARGEKMGAALVFMDVTAVKEMEARLRQQDHLSILGQMAAKIAHEVKNPLFAIIGLAEELEEEEQDPERRELLSMIRQEATLSNQWISGMLTFSRSAASAPEESWVLLGKELPSLVSDFLRVNAKDDVKVVQDLEDELPPVMLSRDNLRHIVFNLMENAMHALPDGGMITVRAHDRKDGFVEVRVEDTGTGIPPEVMPNIFQPFFSTKDGGTGLGLSIVQKIVLDSGGSVEVFSQQNMGTTFVLKLPVRGVSHESTG